EVIMNGDAPASIASVSGGAEAPIPPKTTEQKIAQRNELKAKITLLLAIPDEHLLKFHGIKDAKTLWEAIKTRFGGNKESKKMQKTIMKQQYENFATSRFEGLDKTYDRFQKLISQLEIHGEVISQKDANLKLLRSLPPSWNTHTLIVRNKSDLDTLSMDDLYNNLKVYKAEIKVNSAHNISATSSQGQASALTYADDVMFSFFANQSNSPQLDNEDLEQIDTDDLEEMDLKWQAAMLTMRTKVECYNYHKRCHFARECRAPKSQWNRNGDNTRRVIPVETPANALVVTDGMGYDWSYQAEETPTDFALMAFSSSGSSSSDTKCEILNKANLEIIAYQLGLESLESRIVVHQKNEAVFEKDIEFLKYDVKVRDNYITELKNQLEVSLKEKVDLKFKLEKFETSSRNLTNLINSQLSSKHNIGLSYDSQLNERDLNNKSDVFESASDSSVNESKEDNNQANDRYKAGEGYHAVLPPYTGNFMPPRPNLCFVGLDDFVFKSAISETVTSVHETETSASKTSKECMKKPKIVRSSAPIIEDWESESDDECEIRPLIEQNKPMITNSGKVPVNDVKQSSPRAVTSTSTARYVNTAASRPTVNGAKPSSNVFHKSHSPVRRTFNQTTAPKNSDLKEKINTAKIHNDHGIYSGCSRHMTGNNSFLIDYQEIDGGFVAFGGSPKGGKISGKGGLTYLFAKATIDESNLWHRRLGHINFKTMNKLVRGNLVRGLPLKIFENEHTFVACQKGKRHKASYKTKLMKGIKREFSVARTPQQNGVAKRKNKTLIEAARTMLVDSLLPTDFGLKQTPNLDFMKPFGCLVTILNTLDHLGKFKKKADEGLLVGYSVNSKAFRSSNDKDVDEVPDNGDEGVSKGSGIHDQEKTNSSTQDANTTEPNINIVGPYDLSMPSLEETGIFDDVYNDREVGAEADTNNLELLTIVWTLVDLPNGKRAIGSKWVFRNKKDEKGIIVRNKAKLVAQDYTQEEGIDYDEVFALVARIEAIRIFLAYALYMGFIVYQMDVKSAFLYGTIEEEVYVCQPPSFEDPYFPDKVYKVEKALYGLHQAPRA
nr:hypothetical protein [Tanacetum cinerariifolium]